MHLMGIALGLLVGLTLGLLGGGGSILTVPIFVYVMGFAARQAIAMSLAVVGCTALFGALSHWRAGNVDLRVAAIFGAVTMLGSFAGTRLAWLFSGAAQMTLFAVVMLAAAISMFLGGRALPSAAALGRPPHVFLIGLTGIGVGLLTGLVGVGGGFLIVPALVVLARVPMKQAVGTSLLVIALNAAVGFCGYLGRVEIAWAFMAAFSAVAVAGILVGAHAVRYVPQHALRRAFAVFLLIMGGFILYRNRGAYADTAPPAPAAVAQLEGP